MITSLFQGVNALMEKIFWRKHEVA